MTPFNRFTTRSIVALALATSTISAAENWPQWRGPGSQGISTEAQLPAEWNASKNVVWKTELPAGHSSPIVWGDRVFVTSAVEGDVLAGAKAAGHIVEGQPYVHPDSVAADRKHTFKVRALDAKTGKVLWDRTAYEGPW